jgi:hypothetical protein
VNGTVVCWGANGNGQLGTGDTTPSNIPVPVISQLRTDPSTVVQLTITARDIGLGDSHSCLLTDVRTICWGKNGALQTGMPNIPNSTDQLIPVLAQLPIGEVARGRTLVGGGTAHTCALRPDGAPLCWGDDEFGLIGFDVPNATTTSTPVPVSSFTANVAPQAQFAGASNVVKVIALATCLSSQHIDIDVQLVQGSTVSGGHASGTCQDALAEYPVTVPSKGAGFTAGSAIATATFAIRETGQIVDTQTWQRMITIAP